MLYTVEYVRDGEFEHHHDLSKVESELLMEYIKRTFRINCERWFQEKLCKCESEEVRV